MDFAVDLDLTSGLLIHESGALTFLGAGTGIGEPPALWEDDHALLAVEA
jgi:hypothetical protein